MHNSVSIFEGTVNFQQVKLNQDNFIKWLWVEKETFC
jgi:hypothetical protein